MSQPPVAPALKRSPAGLWIALGGAGFVVLTAIGVVVTIATASAFGGILGRTATPQFSAADASTVLLTESQSSQFGTWAAPQTEFAAVSDAQSELQHSWQVDSPQPSSLPCEFAYSLYPVTNLETGAAETQPVALNDQFVSIGDNSFLSQSVRVFGTSAEAASYMAEMRSLISGCTSYATASWSATVAPLPLAVGLNTSAWVETGTGSAAGGAYYAADLQRGNVVTRITAQAAVGDSGALDQALFTSVVDAATTNLETLKPGVGAGTGSVST